MGVPERTVNIPLCTEVDLYVAVSIAHATFSLWHYPCLHYVMKYRNLVALNNLFLVKNLVDRTDAIHLVGACI